MDGKSSLKISQQGNIYLVLRNISTLESIMKLGKDGILNLFASMRDATS